jgi:hypothetical protein
MLGIDNDGQFWNIVIGAVIGSAVGVVKAYNRGYDLTDWQTYAYIGGGAVAGGAVAMGAGAAAFSATGATGLATGSGLAAATVGGAAAGAVYGAGSSAAFYAMDHGLIGDAKWSTSDFIGGAAKDGLVGAVVGGALGAASYELSSSVRNATDQDVVRYGFEHGRTQDVGTYLGKTSGYEGTVKVSSVDNLDGGPNKFNTRGHTSLDGKTITLYPKSFVDPKTGAFDPTSVIQTFDHEYLGHVQGMSDVTPNAMTFINNEANAAVVGAPNSAERALFLENVNEAYAYGVSSSVSVSREYSASITQYVNNQWAYYRSITKAFGY